jgi:hypothetical protein
MPIADLESKPGGRVLIGKCSVILDSLQRVRGSGFAGLTAQLCSRFRRTPSLRHPLFLEVDERLQGFRFRVSHSPESQAIGVPTTQVESFLLKNRVRQWTRLIPGPNEQVDIVLLVLKNHRRHFLVTHVIKPPANQFEALLAEIKDGRRKIEFSGKPWLHRVLIGGGNVKQVIPY